MLTFYRDGKHIRGPTLQENFKSVNAAKRRSRELQKEGWKFVRP